VANEDIKLFQNLSFVLQGIHKVTYEDRPVPELESSHDVIVNVKYTGICGSDVCTYQSRIKTMDIDQYLSRCTTGNMARLDSLW
jgi:threonine dehydrogenase-like Zn-dependent dehydrogenase